MVLKKLKSSIALGLTAIIIGMPIISTSFALENDDTTSAVEENNVYATESTEESLGDMIEYEDVNYFINLLDSYLQENPNATEDEQNKFLEVQMNEYYSNKEDKITLFSIDYVAGAAGLNSKEKALYNESPTKGLRCMQAGVTASSNAKAKFVSSVLYNGNGDAFRHSLWNALMVKLTNSSWANRWATAHEDGATNQPSIEKTMDLSNNAYGRSLASRVGNVPDQVYIDQLLLDIKNGKLKRIVSGKIVATNGTGRK